MENILKKDCQFHWIEECQQSFDTLKQKMVTVPILVFPDWSKEFHVHVNASYITLGVVLAQPGEEIFTICYPFLARSSQLR
jgi:hypothetical protein